MQKQNKKLNKQKTFKYQNFSKKVLGGYTIIETMIAISLFLIVTMFGMGSLLSASALYKKSQNTRSVMDNLSFVMEDMSRNLRTGYSYRCINDGNISSVEPQDCHKGGGGISFKSSSGSGSQWIYLIENDDDIDIGYVIKKSTNGASGPFVTITPPEIRFDDHSGFSVFGSLPGVEGDINQPFVVIRLTGTIKSSENDFSSFSLQTGVSQRLIDI